MCGIAGVHRRGKVKIRTVNALIDRLLLNIDHRGGDSTGMLSMLDSGETQIVKTTKRAIAFTKSREKVASSARTVLLHTRFATQGAVIERNAHPVVAGKIAAIHNGMIYNDAELFREHGMKRTAEVDSIVIPALIEKLGWDNAEEALGSMRGGAAVAIVNSDKPDELILGRTRGYPLHVFMTKDIVVWASERYAIEKAWETTYGAKPRGEWIVVPEFTMLRVNGSITRTALPIPATATWPQESKHFGGYTGSIYGGMSSNARKREAAKQKAKNRRAGTPTKPGRHLAQLALPVEHEPYMDDAVRDLMRWADCDYEEAYEAVHGVMPPDTLDTSDLVDIDDVHPDDRDDLTEWVDDILMSREDAEAWMAMRRADGWEVGV